MFIPSVSATAFVASIATLGILSPGPDFFMVIKNAARYKRLQAMMTALGIVGGVATHMSYCVAGLAVVITTTPWLFDILKYAGAAYLIWVGLQALLSRGHNSMDMTQVARQEVTLGKAFLQGYLCNLLNPKATLFFLSIFTQVLSVQSGFPEKAWYAGVILMVSVIWWTVLVILIQSAPVRAGLAKAQKVIDKMLGGLLIALGIKVALS